MLLEALVACAGVTLRAVATSLGIEVAVGHASAPRATSTSAARSPSIATRRSASGDPPLLRSRHRRRRGAARDAAEADRALLRRPPDARRARPSSRPPSRPARPSMPGPLRHLGELAKARATKRSSEREDGQALAELEARPLELPAGLEVEWLGVSGYRLSLEGKTLFIDPYLSRVPFAQPAAAPPDPARPGGARPLRPGAGRGRRRARRPHPLRPRRRRAGDRPPLRLQGLRLGLAGDADGRCTASPSRPSRSSPTGPTSSARSRSASPRASTRSCCSASPSPTTATSPASTSTASPPAPTAAARSGGSRSGSPACSSTTRAAPT